MILMPSAASSPQFERCNIAKGDAVPAARSGQPSSLMRVARPFSAILRQNFRQRGENLSGASRCQIQFKLTCQWKVITSVSMSDMFRDRKRHWYSIAPVTQHRIAASIAATCSDSLIATYINSSDQRMKNTSNTASVRRRQ